MKKLLIFVMTCFISIMSVCAINDNNSIQKPFDESALNEGIMNAQVCSLISYFEKLELTTNENKYPDFYAGAYITEDRKKLVICVTDNSEPIVEIIKTGTQNPNIAIEVVEHSYNDLRNESIRLLNEYNSKGEEYTLSAFVNNETPIRITGAGVNVQNNSVLVSIYNSNEMLSIIDQDNMKNTTFELLTNDAEKQFNYIFENSTYIVDQVSRTYYPGEYFESPAGCGTMGYKGKIRDPLTGELVRGFWTAGHCMSSDTCPVWIASNNEALGQCLVRKNEQKVDAAFVELYNQTSTIISSDLKYGDKTLASTLFVTDFAENALVYICGGAREQEGSGYIRDTSYSFILQENGRTYTDFVLTNYPAIRGDSGAVVYALVNTSYVLCGIHKGEDPEVASRRVFTKTDNIKDIWPMHAWTD